MNEIKFMIAIKILELFILVSTEEYRRDNATNSR